MPQLKAGSFVLVQVLNQLKHLAQTGAFVASCVVISVSKQPYLDQSEDVHESVAFHHDDLAPHARLEGLHP